MSVRVLLADRRRIIRQGVRILLEKQGLDVVGEAGKPQEAAGMAQALRPDVAVLAGYEANTADGTEAARCITRACPQVKVVVLTHAAPREGMQAALAAGIRAYVLTSQHASELAHVIREAARGSIHIGMEPLEPAASLPAAAAIPSDPGRPDHDTHDRLTPRERQVLQLIAEGHTTKEIARIMQRSAKTADAHRTRLMEKLDIHQVAGLVRYAIRSGLIEA